MEISADEVGGVNDTKVMLASAVCFGRLNLNAVTPLDTKRVPAVVSRRFIANQIPEDQVILCIRVDHVFADAGGVGAGIAGGIDAAGIQVEPGAIMKP